MPKTTSGLTVVTVKAVRDEAIAEQARRRADELAAELRSYTARPGLLQRRRRKVTVYGPHGRPVGQVDVDDWGNSHHEIGLERVDAVARPAVIRHNLRTGRTTTDG